MLFSANSNRKIRASLFEEMFDMEDENTLIHQNLQAFAKEPTNLEIEISNKTIEALLEEIEHKQHEVFEMYSLAHTNYSFKKYQQTLYYKDIQELRTQVKDVALWLFEGEINTMPFMLKRHFS
jgi:hypothetical protein